MPGWSFAFIEVLISIMPLDEVHQRSEDGTPILSDEEKVVYVEKNAELIFGQSESQGKGTLYVTTKNMIWLDETNASRGYSVDWPFIVMHAVCRDAESFPQPCIYCQLDVEEEEEEEVEEDEDMVDGAVAEQKSAKERVVSEFRLVPADPQVIDEMYKACCDCAALNPDPTDEHDDEHGNFFFDSDEVVGNMEQEEELAEHMGAMSTYANQVHLRGLENQYPDLQGAYEDQGEEDVEEEELREKDQIQSEKK